MTHVQGISAAAALVGWFVALIDAFERRIPNVVILPSYPIALTLLVVASAAEDEWYGLPRAAVGMLAFASFYFVLALLRPGELGLGDVKLAGLFGLALGWFGWSALVEGVFLGFVFAALLLVPHVISHRISGSSQIAFGPFMVIGAVVAILLV